MPADTFYAFVGDGSSSDDATSPDEVRYPARIAVYDDPSMTPRVIVIQPADVRTYLEAITSETTRLSHEQGGAIPFMVIREIVENYIHAAFIAPTISILDGGNTIRFSDQGPGIPDKRRALEYGTTTATEEMKRYIRGVGSGLPLAQQYMLDKGGSLSICDNLSCGTVVTISTRPEGDVSIPIAPLRHAGSRGNRSNEATGGDGVVPASPGSPRGAEGTSRDGIEIGERGLNVLRYLEDHEVAGPSDMVACFGGSQPTWSRELKALEEKGLLVKSGQKRHLTEFGHWFVSSLAASERPGKALADQ